MTAPDLLDDTRLIRFRGLAKKYGKRQIFEHINLDLHPSQSHLLIGKNGSGKSTLLRILAGLLKPDRGRLTLMGQVEEHSWHEQRSALRARVMYMHQTPYLFDGSVEKNLNYAMNTAIGTCDKKLKLQEALRWSGLESLAGSEAKQLSGGEKQRVALARAWLRQSQVLLLDEPTANLDKASRLKTIELLHSLRGLGVCLIIACHEYQEFLTVSDGILQLKQGQLEKFN